MGVDDQSLHQDENTNGLQTGSNVENYISEPVRPSIPDEMPVEKPKLSRRLILAIIVIALIAVAFYLVFALTTKKDVIYRADLSLVSGKVEKSENSTEWVSLKAGDDIKQGEYVRVSGEGKAIVTLDDGSAVRLDSDTRIALTSLDPKNILITNEKGEVYTRVVKADRQFVVKIGDESFQAMGTAYKTLNEEKVKAVFVYESTVKAIRKNVDVAEGKKLYEENQDETSLQGKVLEISKDEIAKDEFVQWNKEQDLKSDDFKNDMGVLISEGANKNVSEQQTTEDQTEESDGQTSNNQRSENNSSPSNAQPTGGDIYLTGVATSNGVSLTWSLSNLDTSNGFKLVRSISAYPIYPGNDYVYLSSGSSRSYNWQISDGKVYHFRVCQYDGAGKCLVYSNDITITTPFVATGVNSINLSGSGVNISWSVNGYSAKGFKVVWSKNSKPTYPTRSTDQFHYLSSPNATSDTISAFSGSGTYHVRVCEYLGGSCGKYSNEITVNL